MFLGMAVNVEEGAMTTLYVATHPQAPKVDGVLFRRLSTGIAFQKSYVSNRFDPYDELCL